MLLIVVCTCLCFVAACVVAVARWLLFVVCFVTVVVGCLPCAVVVCCCFLFLVLRALLFVVGVCFLCVGCGRSLMCVVS